MHLSPIEIDTTHNINDMYETFIEQFTSKIEKSSYKKRMKQKTQNKSRNCSKYTGTPRKTNTLTIKKYQASIR